MDPETMQAIISWLLSGGQIPQVAGSYNSKGEPLPLEPSDQKGQMDTVHKLVQGLSNPMTMGMLNPETLGPSAFEPTVTMEPLERPGEVIYNDWKSAPEGSIRRWMADEYKASGFNPELVFGKLQTFMSTPADQLPDDASRGLQANFMSQLPPSRNYVGNDALGDPIYEPGPDLSSVNTQLQKMHSDRISDPVGNYEENGVQYNRTEEPSELMQAYQQLGLADPRQKFTGESLLRPDKAVIKEVLPQVSTRDVSERRRAAESQVSAMERLLGQKNADAPAISTPRPELPFNGLLGKFGPPPQSNYPKTSRPTLPNFPEADIAGMPQALIDAKDAASAAQNEQTAIERRLNGDRDKVYGRGAGDLVGARVNAHRLRQQGVTPFTKQRDEMLAMLRAYGVGI